MYYDDDVDWVSYELDSPTEEEQEEGESPKKLKKIPQLKPIDNFKKN